MGSPVHAMLQSEAGAKVAPLATISSTSPQTEIGGLQTRKVNRSDKIHTAFITEFHSSGGITECGTLVKASFRRVIGFKKELVWEYTCAVGQITIEDI